LYNSIATALLCVLLCNLLAADGGRGALHTSRCYLPLAPSLSRAFHPAKIHPYRVSGRTVTQIAHSIHYKGPFDRQGRSRYSGYYRWFVSSGNDSLKYRSYVELPCLQRTNPRVRLRWRRYINVLALHELNHHRLFMAGISEFQQSPHSKAGGYWQRTLASMRARDREWDAVDVVPPFDKF
jgi:hypothetical protein